jgi:hypothetical protein
MSGLGFALGTPSCDLELTSASFLLSLDDVDSLRKHLWIEDGELHGQHSFAYEDDEEIFDYVYKDSTGDWIEIPVTVFSEAVPRSSEALQKVLGHSVMRVIKRYGRLSRHGGAQVVIKPAKVAARLAAPAGSDRVSDGSVRGNRTSV